MADNGKNKKNGEPAKNSFGKFLREFRAEVKRITWAPKKDVKKAALVVFTFCVIAIVIVGLMDMGFETLSKMVFK